MTLEKTIFEKYNLWCMTQVSEQVMKHNFLTICTSHVSQTLQANLNQPDFQCLLMSIQRSARTCKIRWKGITVIFMRFRFISPFSCKWKTCPALHDYACLHPGLSLIRMSTVILNFLQLCSCYWFLSLPLCLCQIPLQSDAFSSSLTVILSSLICLMHDINEFLQGRSKCV